MSKTRLGLFAIIAISAVMVISVQYSVEATPSKKYQEIFDQRIWTDTQIGPGGVCNAFSDSTIKNGYFIWALLTDGRTVIDEESIKDYYDSTGTLIGTTTTIIHDDQGDSDGDGKTLAHGMIKVKCFNGEKNSNEPYVLILHKNGKTTEN